MWQGISEQSSHTTGCAHTTVRRFLLWKALKRGGVLARAKTLKVLHVITVVFEVGFV